MAIAYLERRAVELGYKSYHIRFRHFMAEPATDRSIEAGTSLFLLVEVSAAVRVESETGVFDLTETATNELQYEHQGIIRLTNYSAVIQHVQMIQLILKDEQDANRDRKI